MLKPNVKLSGARRASDLNDGLGVNVTTERIICNVTVVVEIVGILKN